MIYVYKCGITPLFNPEYSYFMWTSVHDDEFVTYMSTRNSIAISWCPSLLIPVGFSVAFLGQDPMARRYMSKRYAELMRKPSASADVTDADRSGPKPRPVQLPAAGLPQATMTAVKFPKAELGNSIWQFWVGGWLLVRCWLYLIVWCCWFTCCIQNVVHSGTYIVICFGWQTVPL